MPVRIPARAIVSLSILSSLLFLPSVQATTVEYGLVAESEYQEGCQEPCECPILSSGLGGSFTLHPAGSEDGFDLFDVTDVRWVIGEGPSALRRIARGSGALRIGKRPMAFQRLELDLRIDDGPPTRFDSGLVPLGAEFPTVVVAVAMNAFYCYDRVFFLHAAPESTGVDTPSQRVSWGRIKSHYTSTP